MLISRSLLLSLALFCSAILHAQFDWQHTDGPDGGATWYIYNNDEYAFYPDEFHLYRSADGLDWEKFGNEAIWPLAVTNDVMVGQFWAGNTFYYTAPTEFKISFDDGETWSLINKPDGLLYPIVRLAVCSHGIYIPVGQDTIIHRSQDDGMTWDTIPAPIPFGYDVWSFDDRLYLGNSSHLWRTDANGQNWTDVTPPLVPQNYIRNIYAENENLLVVTEKRVWYSNDDGATWDFFSDGGDNGFNEITIAGGKVYVQESTKNLYVSEDYGLNWTELPEIQNRLSVLGMGTIDGKPLVSTYNKGVFIWDETAQSFVESNQGIHSASIYDLDFKDGKLWAGAGNGLFSFDEQSGIWDQNSVLPMPRHNYENVALGNNGLMAAADKWGDTLYISSDGGVEWTSIPSYNGPFSWSGFIGRLEIVEDVIFVCDQFSSPCNRSADQGQNWEVLDFNIMPYLGTLVAYNGLILNYDEDHIYSSADQGETWQVFADFPLGGLFSLFRAGDLFFAASYQMLNGQWRQMLHVSEDGTDWTYAGDGLPDMHFGIDPDELFPGAHFFAHQGTYYIYQGEHGFFASLDTCETWLPVERRRGHQAYLADSIFYTGGFGGGVIRSGLPNVYGELISGGLFHDANANGTKDVGEVGIQSQKIGLTTPYSWYSYYFTTTDEEGNYVLGVMPTETDTLRPFLQNQYVENITPPFYTAADTGPGRDFAVQLTPDITDLRIYGNQSRPRPGFDQWTFLRCENNGSLETDATVSFRMDSKLTFLEAVPPPTAVFGDSLIWELGELPLFSKRNIWVKTNLVDTAQIGELVKSTARAFSPEADETPADNIRIMCDTVVSSFDPNDKKVEPADGLTPTEIAEGKELFFTIRFQNTGNFPAERVRITDMIDTALYWPSLRFVAASHEVSSFELRPGGLLEILFDDIFLPDSVNSEPESHGFVTYAVQRNKQFNAFHAVTNMAAIYFDFNEPVFTNEVSFTLPDETTVSTSEPKAEKTEAQLLIFPNPAQSGFTVSTGGKLSGRGFLSVENAEGKKLLWQEVGDLAKPRRIDSGQLPPGVYFVKMAGENGQLSGQVVVVPD